MLVGLVNGIVRCFAPKPLKSVTQRRTLPLLRCLAGVALRVPAEEGAEKTSFWQIYPIFAGAISS